ncbi:MAG: homoserine kinase [Alphaproteobacteria bacterium]|nr:homoserine kinase [Alphaproteobacteria bacterium]MDE2163186.1 homoserine kinase [Alphaproteobacteria bacterium]MDE2500174.1 homoserine kinase [Alphaproteobacteria bacterium]
MAVYTEVSFEDLEVFLAGYDLGAPLSFKGIAEGVENSNYYLQTERGSFILTLYEKRVHADDLPFFLGLLEHLAARGIACPLPVRSRAGAQSAHLNGRPAALLTFLNGLSLRRPETAHCAAAGAALAALHAAGRDFTIARPNALGIAGWSPLATQCAPRADTVQDGLAALIKTSLADLAARWPRELPAGVIHADLFPDNVLFMNGAVSGLIDFYFACNDSYAYDLAVMLNAWCFEGDGAYNITKGKSLISAYRKQRDLSAAEIDALPALAAGAALRFLLTRLYDWLNHDPTALVRPKDPRDFAKRLRFHRTVRSASEYGL